MNGIKGVRGYLRTTLIGGVLVALPIFVLANLFLWLLGWLNDSLAPMTGFWVAQLDVAHGLAELLSILVILVTCFALGAVVATSLGERMFTWLERHTLQRLPGYKPIKEIVSYIGRNDRNPFRRPVLVRFSENMAFTGFLSDESGDDCTVFVPTGPNPTTGLVVHVNRDQLTTLDASSTQAMQTILACGAGAQALMPRS